MPRQKRGIVLRRLWQHSLQQTCKHTWNFRFLISLTVLVCYNYDMYNMLATRHIMHLYIVDMVWWRVSRMFIKFISHENSYALLEMTNVEQYHTLLHRNTGPEGWRLRQRHFEILTSLVRRCRKFFPAGSAFEIWSEFRWFSIPSPFSWGSWRLHLFPPLGSSFDVTVQVIVGKVCFLSYISDMWD